MREYVSALIPFIVSDSRRGKGGIRNGRQLHTYKVINATDNVAGILFVRTPPGVRRDVHPFVGCFKSFFAAKGASGTSTCVRRTVKVPLHFVAKGPLAFPTSKGLVTVHTRLASRVFGALSPLTVAESGAEAFDAAFNTRAIHRVHKKGGIRVEIPKER